MTLLPPKLSRFTAVAALLLKYGRMRIAVDDPLALPAETSADDGRSPGELADDLERLGPTFVKLGQVQPAVRIGVERGKPRGGPLQFRGGKVAVTISVVFADQASR